MKECIFSLGLIDKKLIWALAFGIIQIIKELVNNKFLKDLQHDQLINIGGGIGQTLIILVPYCSCHKNQIGENEKKCTKKNFLYFFLLIFLNLIHYTIIAINVSLTGVSSNHHDSDCCLKMVLK